MRPVGAEVGELAAQGRCVLSCCAGWQVARTAPLWPRRELGPKVPHASYIFVGGWGCASVSSVHPSGAVPCVPPWAHTRGYSTLHARRRDGPSSCWLLRLSCGATAHPNTSSPPLLAVGYRMCGGVGFRARSLRTKHCWCVLRFCRCDISSLVGRCRTRWVSRGWIRKRRRCRFRRMRGCLAIPTRRPRRHSLCPSGLGTGTPRGASPPIQGRGPSHQSWY